MKGFAAKIVLLLTLLGCINNLINIVNAQQQLLVENIEQEGTHQILVKWFISELYTSDGYFVYRKDSAETSWQKLNSRPIHMGEYTIPAEKLAQDELLEFLIEIIESQPWDEIEDMAQFTMVLKAIIDQDFARYLGIFYADTTIEPGKKYSYKVTRFDGSDERTIDTSDEVYADSVTTTGPPKDIELEPGNACVYFKWEPESERYFAVNIYRKDTINDDFKRINELPVIIAEKKNENGELAYPEFFYSDKELVNGKEYEYKIKSIDFFGIESTDNQTLTAMPVDLTPPPSPKDADANFENGNVDVSWKYRNTDKIIGFNIYRGRKSKGEYQKLNSELLTPETTEFIDTNPPARNYYYYITSVSKYSIEGKSAMAYVEVPDLVAPVTPTGLRILADTGAFILTWEANTETDLMGYQVYRKPEDAPVKDYFQITPRPVRTNEFVDDMPENVKNNFEYRIAAIDSAYNMSGFSATVSAFLPDVTPPDRPYLQSVQHIAGGISITWVPNIEDDLQGYYIYRTTVKEGSSSRVLLSPTILSKETQSFIDKSASSNGEHMYELLAVDEAGNHSALSEKYSIQVFEEKEHKTVELMKIDGKFQKRGNKNQLSWAIPEIADEYMGTIVYKKTGDENYKACSGLLTDNSFTDKDIKPDTQYSYELRTYTSSGMKWKSEEIKIKTAEF